MRTSVVGHQEPVLATVKRCKLVWFVHVTLNDTSSKTTLEGGHTVEELTWRRRLSSCGGPAHHLLRKGMRGTNTPKTWALYQYTSHNKIVKFNLIVTNIHKNTMFITCWRFESLHSWKCSRRATSVYRKWGSGLRVEHEATQVISVECFWPPPAIGKCWDYARDGVGLWQTDCSKTPRSSQSQMKWCISAVSAERFWSHKM